MNITVIMDVSPIERQHFFADPNKNVQQVHDQDTIVFNKIAKTFTQLYGRLDRLVSQVPYLSFISIGALTYTTITKLCFEINTGMEEPEKTRK